MASETLAVALVGMVEVISASLSIKRLDPASTKQKEELEYPQQLQKPLHLQPGMQLKVCTIEASIALLTLLPWLSLVLPLSVRVECFQPSRRGGESMQTPSCACCHCGQWVLSEGRDLSSALAILRSIPMSILVSERGQPCVPWAWITFQAKL